MKINNDYLYHCRGCRQHDEEYPQKESECIECKGSGWLVTDNDDVNNNDLEEECPFCLGDGKYMDWVKVDYHKWSRSDAYGIYTGLYCDDCYDDPNIYPYRKDNYFDPGYAGESLEPEDY